MMKRKYAFLGIAALLCFSSVTTAQAGAPDENGAKSQAVFQLDNSDPETKETTGPVDPEEPQNEIQPDEDGEEEGGITGNKGRLRIDYVSNYHFGSQTITSGAQEFHAALVEADSEHTEIGRITVPNFVQVSDWRGTGEGWTLSVKQNDYFTIFGGRYAGEQMEGAQLSLNNIKPNAVNPQWMTETASDYIVFDVMDEFENILIAQDGTGLGTHVAYFGDYNKGDRESALSSVKLEIPEQVKKIAASYRTTLTWQLTDAPENKVDDPDLQVYKSVDKAEISVGDVITYKFLLSNPGSEDRNITLVDTLSDKLELYATPEILGDAASKSSVHYSANRNDFSFTGTVSAGGQLEVSVSAELLSGEPGDVIRNIAYLSYYNSEGELKTISSNVASVVIK